MVLVVRKCRFLARKCYACALCDTDWCVGVGGGGGVFAGIAGADWCKSFVFKGSLSISGV